MANALAVIQPRLPMPREFSDAAKWRVLTDAIFPRAKSAASILLALDYCTARNLDVMKRPVNIVPMWDSEKGGYVETVWPAITETQVTAARTGEWAGLDKPVYGPIKEQTFKGRKKTKDGWQDAVVTVAFPEWCERTVYRLIDGQRCA